MDTIKSELREGRKPEDPGPGMAEVFSNITPTSLMMNI
jgi:hypothetical protein